VAEADTAPSSRHLWMRSKKINTGRKFIKVPTINQSFDLARV
jgi:hypothetical protein